MKNVIVIASFDDLRSRHVRLLEEAAKLGDVHALVWPDEKVKALTKRPPKFPASERLYLVQAIRHVHSAHIAPGPPVPNAIPEIGELHPHVWVVPEDEETPEKKDFCARTGIELRVVPAATLRAIPPGPALRIRASARQKVIVTGCYDWLHSGHIRFFEEAAGRGDLYVDVGSDENIRLLKGKNHPLFPQDERLYMVRSVRHVVQAFIGSGYGWMDAAPEMSRIKPNIYLVNEDGDRIEKRAYCEEKAIEYIVLKRLPKEGLPRRESSDLRGF
jgi:cytidyltransferase-like protein